MPRIQSALNKIDVCLLSQVAEPLHNGIRGGSNPAAAAPLSFASETCPGMY
jgi:hypothetical protein